MHVGAIHNGSCRISYTVSTRAPSLRARPLSNLPRQNGEKPKDKEQEDAIDAPESDELEKSFV